MILVISHKSNRDPLWTWGYSLVHIHTHTLTHTMGMSDILDGLNVSGSPITLALITASFLFLLLAIFLYTFQSKLIYLPQFPPGSREQVWQPSRFGYGPGLTDQDKWEEVEIVTGDKVKLQAFWIKAPSKWNRNENEGIRNRFNKDNDNDTNKDTNKNNDKDNDAFTVLYLQANAGNIVTVKQYINFHLFS